MTDGEYRPVAVSRRISAPAHDIFRILADPRRLGAGGRAWAPESRHPRGAPLDLRAHGWTGGMARTLERLDRLCTS